jgi:hypothetical protein
MGGAIKKFVNYESLSFEQMPFSEKRPSIF